MVTCNICQDQQVQEEAQPEDVVHRQYIGETSRTIRVRAKQHQQDLHRCSRNRNLEEGTSWMWDHLQTVYRPHPSINPEEDFTFSVINYFKDPMTRQIEEAVRI